MKYLLLFICISAMAADVKISALPAGNPYNVGSNDVFPYVDMTAGVTKKLKVRDIANLSAFSVFHRSVVNGGNANYNILFGDYHVRSGSTLTASRNYQLPLCSASNIGEEHNVSNTPSQGFSIFVTTSGGNTINDSALKTLFSGSAVGVICGASGKWDIENAF